MQPRGGIRLRHLQINGKQKNNNYNQINNQVYPAVQKNNQKYQKNSQRSVSPKARKRIFNKGEADNNYLQDGNSFDIADQNYGKGQYLLKPQLNNLGQKPSHNAESDRDSEVQRLIFSLKQKSLQLEKKDEIIKRLRKQIQNLNTQNRQYRRQIADLREEFGNKLSSSKNQTSNGLYNHTSSQQLQPFYEPLILNQPYKRNPKFQNDTRIDQSQNIVSPLMALNSKQSSSSSRHSSVKQYELFQMNKKPKQLNYDMRVRDQPIKYNKMKDSIQNFQRSSHTSYNTGNSKNEIIQNPFKKYQTRTYETDNVNNIEPIYKNRYLQRKTQQQSFKKQDYFPIMEKSNKSSRVPEFQMIRQTQIKMPQKSLQIEDSKQFQFQDFDSNQVDQSGSFF